METLSFISGLLVITSAIILVGVVVGLLRIIKLTSQLRDLKLRLDYDVDNIQRQFQSQNDSIWRQFEATGRDVTVVERTMLNQINEVNKDIHDEIKAIYQHEKEHEDQLLREIDKVYSYTDSRIDKIVVAGVLKEPKRQTING